MTWHWKKLLPVDQFSVRAGQFITEQDRITLTLLYQPLIGAVATSLYMTLFAQLEKDEYWSKEQNHRQLMVMLGVSLDQVYTERKKLEAIGLLKTYIKNEQDDTTYLYELVKPMSPKQFFSNDVLGVYLYNRVGKSHYLSLRQRFTLSAVNKEDYAELTHAFDEVFTSLKHSEMVSNLQESKLPEGEEIVKADEQQNQLHFEQEQFDFSLFETHLAKSMIPESGFTYEEQQLIIRLAFVYKIDPIQMSHLVEQVLLHTNEINVEELRKKVQDWYRIEHGTNPPSLGLRTQPANYRTMTKSEPETEEERVIHFYETTAPLDLLEIRAVGAQVAPADIKIVESLIIDYHLLPGVANVLIDYILYRYEMKLPKSLTYKIASQWSRLKIKTVKDAMAVAREEEQKETSTRQPNARQNRNKARKDILPKWLIAEKEKEKQEAEAEQKADQPAHKEETKDDLSYEQMLAQLKTIKEQKR